MAAITASPPTCQCRQVRTRLRVEVRRFYCLNPACRCRTFAEAPMPLLAPRARRTRRLCEAQARVGLACGGAGGARLLAPRPSPTIATPQRTSTPVSRRHGVADAPAIATFASGLDADLAAVRAALTEPWSSGQAEVQINRLKLIERQCCGRAGLDLLKRRMVLDA